MAQSEDKRAIRRRMRSRRRSLDVAAQRRAARRLDQVVYGLLRFKRPARIAAYWPMGGEIDLLPALVRLARSGWRIHFPVLRRGKSPRMYFAPWTPDATVRRNRVGIPEPVTPPSTWVRPLDMDWVLLPLVAFDTRGYRIGMGGGYYDASFSTLRCRRTWNKPRLVGVAHDFQRIDAVITDDWDVPMHGVLTDERAYLIGG